MFSVRATVAPMPIVIIAAAVARAAIMWMLYLLSTITHRRCFTSELVQSKQSCRTTASTTTTTEPLHEQQHFASFVEMEAKVIAV
jgi:hypothetical protein